MIEDTYKIVQRLPEVTEFQLLRQVLGYDEVPDDVVEKALRNSLFAVCAERDSLLIGCVRVVGDGGLYFFIEDLMILPGLESDAEEKSITDYMMDEVMEYLKNNAPKNAFFCIKDSKEARDHCRQLGFRMPVGDNNSFQ